MGGSHTDAYGGWVCVCVRCVELDGPRAGVEEVGRCFVSGVPSHNLNYLINDIVGSNIDNGTVLVEGERATCARCGN